MRLRSPLHAAATSSHSARGVFELGAFPTTSMARRFSQINSTTRITIMRNGKVSETPVHPRGHTEREQEKGNKLSRNHSGPQASPIKA